MPAIGRTGKTTMFVKGEDLVKLYYLEGASLIGYLIEKFGPDRFGIFCRELREAKNINEALSFTYPTQISDIYKLEEKWLKYLKEH
ncbi:MAG: hypothetical protein JW734_08425 [Candidatus Omnitrophica bacterium]|nr:hypothetical protein [Candidatus Omnitrophota bacterium]